MSDPTYQMLFMRIPNGIESLHKKNIWLFKSNYPHSITKKQINLSIEYLCTMIILAIKISLTEYITLMKNKKMFSTVFF